MMLRRLLPFAFLLCAGCASRPPLTPLSAGALAARLANDRCFHDFGARPFAPEDFDVFYREGRWHWGEDGNPVDGFKPIVSFGPYGNAADVAVSPAADEK